MESILRQIKNQFELLCIFKKKDISAEFQK